TAPLAVMVPSVPNPTSPIITFDASASSGAITSYEWEFSAPGFSATDNGVVVNVNVPFDVLGTMYVTITTRKAEGCGGWARYEMEMDEFRPQDDEDEGEELFWADPEEFGGWGYSTWIEWEEWVNPWSWTGSCWQSSLPFESLTYEEWLMGPPWVGDNSFKWYM